jgi:hypothetical protein
MKDIRVTLLIHALAVELRICYVGFRSDIYLSFICHASSSVSN